MKKTLLMSIALSSMLSASGFNFTNIDTKTEIRYGHLTESASMLGATTNKTDDAISGSFNASTTVNSNIELQTTINFIKNLNDGFAVDSVDRLSELSSVDGQDDIVYIGEAYLSYQPNYDFNFMLGYQSFDLPFLNAFDNRLVKNTFESVLMEYIGIENVYLSGGYINRFAGNYGVAGIESAYKGLYTDVNGEEVGATAFINAQIKYSDMLLLKGYYYNVQNITNVLLAELILTDEISDNFSMSASGMYSNQSELNYSGVEADIISAKGAINYKNTEFSFAYTTTDMEMGKQTHTSIGIAPYYTATQLYSVEDMSISSTAYNVGASFKFSLEADKKENIITSVNYAKFEGKDSIIYDTTVIDFTTKYKYNKDLDFDIIVSSIDYDRFEDYLKVTSFVRANFRF